MAKERRQYSEAEKAAALAALAANGGNLKKTAREMGLPRGTLLRWSRGEAVPFSVSQQGPQKRGSLADALEDLVWQCVELLPGKLKEAGPTAAGTVLGIAFDKMRLLRGEATSITDDAGRARETLGERLTQLAARNGTNGVHREPDPVGSGGSEL